MKKLLVFLAIAWACCVLAQAPAQPAQANPSFDFVKRLVGGTWSGSVGALPVSLKFELVLDGQVVEGKGIVGDPQKPVLKMLSRLGIDPANGKVYYVDMHNATGVLFGHASMEKDVWKCDFRSLVGGEGHWISYEKLVDDDTFESSMYEVDKDGKEKFVHALRLKRNK